MNISFSSADQQLLYGVATTQYAQGHYEEASKILTLLLAADPLDPRLLFSVAACMYRMGRISEAFLSYMGAWHADPGDIDAARETCACLIRMGQIKDAAEALKGILALDWPESEGLTRARQLCSFLEELGEAKAAVAG